MCPGLCCRAEVSRQRCCKWSAKAHVANLCSLTLASHLQSARSATFRVSRLVTEQRAAVWTLDSGRAATLLHDSTPFGIGRAAS
jgi:hypothetical protein